MEAVEAVAPAALGLILRLDRVVAVEAGSHQRRLTNALEAGQPNQRPVLGSMNDSAAGQLNQRPVTALLTGLEIGIKS